MYFQKILLTISIMLKNSYNISYWKVRNSVQYFKIEKYHKKMGLLSFERVGFLKKSRQKCIFAFLKQIFNFEIFDFHKKIHQKGKNMIWLVPSFLKIKWQLYVEYPLLLLSFCCRFCEYDIVFNNKFGKWQQRQKSFQQQIWIL